ncbi:1-deoxy-D-xylulose-5-phosphate reductoisomerase [Candidatus Tachikawaea gelatinosa]|uniref:1-deoxy-D-xylulose 5-phosphate reductoisomerase n=1 Tax=Candidatus Tachikawaea gelatinosa TaxID=1410383 RepID=A0A090AQ09_9ENTR|nr:1-deoxy-D-xylulose-5-phosphate reductoisomerase [Candidatus Tachikawaea gelatinosa]BAP58397.1 1-deoxy-D-xylulose 5-phosphate reductoisomerase [Candidatus Tachikawaea gelatinosa]
MKKITILGSTGSIGRQTLAVIRKNLQTYQVIALVAGKNISLLTKQCQEFKPTYAAVLDKNLAEILRKNFKELKLKTEVFFGIKNFCKLAALNEIDQVMSAIVGFAGLLPTLSAIRAGKTILLANKESLITCGKLFINEAKIHNARLLPVDSEHNAIFQSLPFVLQSSLYNMNLKLHGINSIILTGSGGPFRTLPLKKLSSVTANQAFKHPNWLMGKKNSIDSATMMNKGFEYIGACFLFNANINQVEILIHPESIIHSMVRYCDGSILAQLSETNMEIPIAHAMAWPNRISTKLLPLDFTKISSLNFEKPDFKRYPCLKIALNAYLYGQSAIISLNAANEIAVESFIKNKIKFTDIAIIISNILNTINFKEPSTIEEIIEIDLIIRKKTIEIVNQLNKSY